MENKKGLIGVLFVFIIITIVVVFIGYGVAYAFTTGHETITVKEKEVKYSGDDAKYLIGTEDGQVFQITDSWVKWRFDSSNLYMEIEEGETYRINTQGWRFGFLSDYKNILEIKLAE